MENNPYQAPQAEITQQVSSTRSVWWKVYFFIITFLNAISMLSLVAEPATGLSEIISLVIWLVATVGLFGFSFQKAIYKPSFWHLVLIATVGFGVLYYFVSNIDLRMGLSDIEYYVINAFTWGLMLPGYIGLYLYGRPDDISWSKKQR